MINKVIQSKVNIDGSYKSAVLGSVTALSGFTTTIQLISPINMGVAVMVNFLVYDARNENVSLFLEPTNKKGADVTSDVDVANWNVWEVDIDAVALSKISKYRAGRIGISFTFYERTTSNIATNYMGLFDSYDTIPTAVYTQGDYFVCNAYNVNFNGMLFNYQDNAVFHNGKWIKDRNVKLILTTATQDLAVDPSLLANVPEVDEQDILDIIANWGQAFVDTLDLKPRVEDLEVETERLDDEIIRVEQKVDNHIEDLDNPHGVTAEQVDTYVKTTIDNKDANTLQQAKDYTYSKVEIDNKDTAIMNKANNLENANMFKDVNYNNVNGVLTFTKYDDTTKEIDLPLELLVNSGYYDEVTNELVLVLANGSEIRIPVGDLLTDLDAHNIRFNGSGTNYLVSKTDVESAVKELDKQFNFKIDKDFTPYPELTNDLSDDDYIIVRDISNNQTKKTKVSTLRQFETDTYEYGVRWVEGQSSSTLERVKIVNGEMTVGSATGLVANVGIDDQVVENSFDNIDIFIRDRVVIGGNTLVRIKKYYIREYSVNDGGTIRNYLLMSAKKGTGYRLPISFDNGDGTEKDYAYISAYEGYVDGNGVARSIGGVLPSHTITRNNARISSRKNDGDGTNTNSLWGLQDIAEYYDLVQVPIWIEFSNLNTQVGIGLGVVDLTFDANTVADSTVANTAIIANNANFDVGMTIYLSTGTYHQITQIDVDTPIAGQTTITFNGATVTPVTGVNLYPRQYFTGMTDSITASTGFYKANDGKHPFKWRGIENVWGNIWKFVDGVKISNWYAWVSTKPSHYDDLASDVNGDYGSNWTKLSYQNALSNGYISKLGYDDRFPFARLPIEVGAGSTTYYADYYYQNSGDRILLVGGSWTHSSYAGLTFWYAYNALSSAYYNIGFRLSYRP